MKTKIFASTLLTLTLLTSCAGVSTEPTPTAVDIGAIQTAAVQTVIAEVTQTASAFTPPPTATEAATATSEPTQTPTPNGPATPIPCDNLEFVSDSSVPDGTQMTAGQEFVKTWKVKNVGTCTWTTGYNLINADYGEPMSGKTTALTAEVLPNAEAEISITLKAPSQPGTYSGYWRMANNNGFPFGKVLTVVIIVQ
jgi:hypothetical protein